MYYFLFGFGFGAYVGTRYNLEPYIDSAEYTIKQFLKTAKKKNED